MRKKIRIYKISLFVFCVLAFSFSVRAQNADWIRVQSDSGEFSVEVPAEYGFFADNGGFSISESSMTYPVAEMNMLNAFYEKTLISFESYKASKAVLNTLREKETRDGKTSDIKVSDTKIKQIIFQTEDSYTIKRFFNSDNYIYILTASSRTGETPAMKRFFDSMIFDPKAKAAANPKNVSFAKMKATPIGIEAGGIMGNNPAVGKEDKLTKLLILSKPAASYTSSARINLQQGAVRMRITFSKDGRISQLNLLNDLDESLIRQALFAAIRIKFLPQEINDKPVTVTKTIEYSFQIY